MCFNTVSFTYQLDVLANLLKLPQPIFSFTNGMLENVAQRVEPIVSTKTPTTIINILLPLL